MRMPRAAVTAAAIVVVAVVAVFAIPRAADWLRSQNGDSGAPRPTGPETLPTLAAGYPVPDGALHVSPAGDDAGSGATQKPFRTLKRAVSAASPGATIVLRAGDYREEVGTITKPLTLQPFPGESAWLKGSLVVSGWVPEGPTGPAEQAPVWKASGWAANVPRDDCHPRTVDPETNPLACQSDMVFVDGRPLAQVGSQAGVGTGQFFVDQEQDSIYIGDDPTGRVVESSAYGQALELAPGAAGSVVRGLGFAQYSPPYQRPMVRIAADGVVFENNVVTRSAMFGLSVSASNVTLRANTVSDNALVGLAGQEPHNLALEGNTFARNNTERFAQGWEAAGVKLVLTRTLVARDNTFVDNLGKGFWCDGSCFDTTFVRNRVVRNDSGFFYEISHKAILASNIFDDNRVKSITLASSSDVSVYNNTFLGRGIAVHVYDGEPRQKSPTPEDLKLGITWTAAGIDVKNNIFSADRGTSFLLTVDRANQRDGNSLVRGLDFNVYSRPAPGPPAIARWAQPGGGFVEYPTLAELQAATGKESGGTLIDGGASDSLFVDRASGDYRLRDDSQVRGKGSPLPDDVARALGVAPANPDPGALL